MKKKVHVFFLFLLFAFLTVPSAWAASQYLSLPCSGSVKKTLNVNDPELQLVDYYSAQPNNAYYSCNSSAVIEAPSGYGLKVTGNVTIEKSSSENLWIYNNYASEASNAEKLYSTNASSDNIGTYFTNTNRMTVRFVTDASHSSFDLKINVVPLYKISFTQNASYLYIRNPYDNALSGSQYTTFAEGATIVLRPTLTMSGNEIMNSFRATRNDNGTVVKSTINGDSIKFTMPASDVSMTPTYVSRNNPGYFNMMDGTMMYEIPAGVTSFKVYDDGGSSKGYSNSITSYLKLKAPDGYTLKVTGTVRTQGPDVHGKKTDYLLIYRSFKKNVATLIAEIYSPSDGEEKYVDTTSGQEMMLLFHSDDRKAFSGLDLTVSLVPVTYTISVDPYSNGTVSVVSSAITGSTVTITASANAGYIVKSMSAATSSGSNVPLTKGGGNTWIFTMPPENVVITPVFITTSYNITYYAGEGGRMTGTSTATAGTSVTLTANPLSSAYLLKDVNVVSANNGSVAVSGGWFTNAKASFTMPMADVFVTPSFTDDWSAAGGLYINMPKTGTIDANIPAGVQSFKVYDDGGMSGNYSINSNGKLVLTAPSGYVLQLTGLMRTGDTTGQSQLVSLNPTTYKFVYTCSADDYLEVYDGSNTSASNLVRKVTSSCDETRGPQLTSVNRVLSSGNTMTLLFKSGELRPTTFGLNLLVKLIPSTNKITYVDENSGGTVTSSSPKTGNIGSIVNYTYSYSSDYLVSEIKVEAENGDAVEVSGGWYNNKQASFKMPPSNVTVKSAYTNDLTADGGLYINMPKTGTIDANIPAGVQSFKIYDDGGMSGNYSINSDGKLVLTAPSGYVLQLTGLMRTGDTTGQSQLVSLNPTTYKFVYTCSADDYLEVYDGSNTSASNLIQKVTSSCDETYGPQLTSVNRVLSSGNTMTLLFKSGELRPTTFGLDLMVKVISTKHTITFKTVANGIVKSDKASANAGEKVTLTAYPSLNCMMSSISVKDSASDKEIDVTGGWYSGNKMTFTMPDNDVVVTPKFTKELSAEGGLYINMQPGKTVVNVSKTVKSFYVYDNGGKDKNYRDYSNDTLVLEVPAGYRMRLTGTMVAENRWDVLRVYDGENTEATQLFGASAFVSGAVTDIGDTVVSSGASMTITFNSDDGKNYDGYALKVTVELAHYAVIVKPAPGGEVYVMGGDTLGAGVLLFASGTGSNRLSGIQVTDKNGNPVKAPIYDFDRSTFTMPQGGVTVIPTFTSDLTAEGGLHLDMVKDGYEIANIPEGVRSFKLYDNGGANGNYENNSSDILTITAPEGYRLNVTGSINVESGHYDSLYIFDGTSIGADTLFSGTCSGSSAYDIGSIRSKGRSLTFHFKSDGNGVRSGLDLTVKVLKPVHLLTIADIPQQSYTGDSIKPTPIIKDGARTLVENTDYTLSYSSNTNSGEASVTIRGMGDYIGSTTLTFTIGPKVTQYAAINILEDERGMGVAVDGNYNGDDTVMITDSIQVDFVEYGRKFSTSGFSTIVLPFDVNTSNVSGLKKVAAFSEIRTNDAGSLVAVMSLVWKDSVGVPDTTLKANTPYMVLMNGTNFAVDGGVTLVPTVEPVVRSGTWEFRGTLAKRVWADGDSDLGHVYGFAAEERPEQNIKIGQFVKAAAGAWIRPGRAYLINVPEEQGNHVGAGRPAIAALPSVFLPEEMDVVIEDKENGSTTFVGRFNARTGKFVNMKARTYDLKGRNVKGHNAKGMFIRK